MSSSPHDSLSEQKALVTGATSGLGKAFDPLFAGRVRSPYYLVAAIAPGMAARGSGSIGLPVTAAYGATKGAIEALTRSWAAEFSPQRARANAVSPAPVYTDGAYHEEIEQLGATTLLHRAAHPAEIAQVIAFLAPPRASYVTGTTVSVNGGRTAI